MGSVFAVRSIALARLVGVVAAATLLWGLTGCERWSLDRQMEAMCRKDGGLHVYEKVALPASEFSNLGEPFAKYATSAKSFEDRLGPDYRYVVERTVVAGLPDADPERGQGRVTRVHEKVLRRSDGKLLGEHVRYVRGGGDFSTFGFQPSAKHCPDEAVSLISSVFFKEN